MDNSFEKDITQFVEVQKAQRQKGLEKYKTTLADAELTFKEGLTHAEEEIVDAWNYLQKLNYIHQKELEHAYNKGYNEGFKAGCR